MNSSNISYCDLKEFSTNFKEYHVYLCFLVCTLGSIFNILNICVLSTKQMRCPTNYILTSLAVVDVLVMLEYIPFAYLHNVDISYYSYYYTYSFASFIKFHAIFTQSFHFISCCITIILAICRYIAVKFPQNNLKWCGMTRIKWTIFLTYILCPFICLPLYLSVGVQQIQKKIFDNYTFVNDDSHKNITGYHYQNVTAYYLNYKDKMLKDISLYVYAIVIKLFPCIFLTVMSILLIIELLRAKDRRSKLMNPQSGENGITKKVNPRHLEKEKQADRTTRMLLTVLLLFLMVEFPQAILGLLNHIIGNKFEKECYQPLGDLLDLFTLTNSAINLLLYCVMSQKFRTVFKELFFPFIPCSTDRKKQWISLQTVNTLV